MINTKTGSQRERGTGIHSCAYLEIGLASLARTKWIRTTTSLTPVFAFFVLF
ncbi:MAG: hypothetical protein IJ558_03990 [Treponema sp.]|nr:hypothetical protein [Treponema sp.]